MPAIEFNKLNMSYDEKEVLKSISAEIKTGSSTCLLGLNGAGKTTLLEILYGLRKPDSGSISILGYDPFTQPESMRQKVAFVSETCHLYPQMHALELQKFMAPLYEKWSHELFIQKLKEFKVEETVRVKNLSKGSKHKLMLATALAIRPEVLILDEPLAGFDAAIREEVLETVINSLYDDQMTVLISTHQIDEVENVCDRTIILHNQRIVLDEARENLEKSYYRLTAELEEEINFIPTGERILSADKLGKRLNLIIRECTDDNIDELLKGLKVKRREMRRVSLKDIFLSISRQ